MKIGILTFHWATNYGAILQAYALQEYLTQYGNDVSIIDYKPVQYDFSWRTILRHPAHLLHLRKSLIRIQKERKLDDFRRRYLHLTDRYCSHEKLKGIIQEYDVLISGSDQVLNPYYTLHGEGCPTSVYYLDFPETNCLKLGYALSFGCVRYPDEAISYARKFIQNFDLISVREDTGVEILSQLEYSDKPAVVPDPTILLGSRLFQNINFRGERYDRDYVCVYMLRRCLTYHIENSVYIDELHKAYSMEEWLSLIRESKALVTNSYHGMIMAILMHVPFIIELEDNDGAGMNDRMVTLLSRLGLLSRINISNDFQRLLEDSDIDWDNVELKLAEYRKEGECFLKFD